MATRPEDFDSGSSIVLIEDPDEDCLLPVNEWLAALEDDEPVELEEPAATMLERVREEGEA